MNIEDYNYNLPQELIAQTPLKNRSASRLMVLDRNKKTYEDKTFTDILAYLESGDALVINDTKVLPARLIGKKSETNAKIEILLLKDLGNDIWECLCKPMKRLHIGTIVTFGNNELQTEIIEIIGNGLAKVKLIYKGVLMEILSKIGTMPLPPYIKENLKEQERYQTVYAKHLGSAAAPTAGLHFTAEILEKLKKKGVYIVHITLHVGLGTFRPVEETDITKHKMHSEYYEMSKYSADILNKVKNSGHKIYAVGTTSVRTLETIKGKYNEFREDRGETNIFIYPSYEFKGVDGIITNFHLPKSTLIMLISAFAGRDFIMECYKHAVDEKYRFFSFGDAMLIK